MNYSQGQRNGVSCDVIHQNSPKLKRISHCYPFTLHLSYPGSCHGECVELWPVSRTGQHVTTSQDMVYMNSRKHDTISTLKVPKGISIVQNMMTNIYIMCVCIYIYIYIYIYIDILCISIYIYCCKRICVYFSRSSTTAMKEGGSVVLV